MNGYPIEPLVIPPERVYLYCPHCYDLKGPFPYTPTEIHCVHYCEKKSEDLWYEISYGSPKPYDLYFPKELDY